MLKINLFPLKSYDIWAFAWVTVICALSFQHGDVLHTIACSTSYLYGHFTDFYEYNTQIYGYINYLPSTYVIYALWGLPLKVLGLLPREGASIYDIGFLIFWYKGLTTVFFLGTAYLIRLIGLQLDLSKSNATLLMAVWLTSPLAYFSQFIFGQYDILPVFLTLLGIYFYLKNRLIPFALAFGVALTFKYFPFFVFAPLLLLKEKRIKNLGLYLIPTLLPLAAEMALYVRSGAFRQGVIHFPVSERIWNVAVNTGHLQFNVFFLGWFFICGYAYLNEIVDPKELKKWVFFLSLAPLTLLFSLIAWNPQWFILLTPFLAISAFMHPRYPFFYILDLALMLALTALVSYGFSGNVDQTLFSHGILKPFNPNIGDPSISFPMVRFVKGRPDLWLSVMTAGFLLYTFFMYPLSRVRNWISPDDTPEAVQKHLIAIRLRFYAGVLIWVIPAGLAYALTWYRA